MENSLIKHIIKVLSGYDAPVLIIENNDGFLFRADVIEQLGRNNINVSIGNSLSQRVAFELRNNSKTLFLINKQNRQYLEDIEAVAIHSEFFLSQYLSEYHIPSIKDLSLLILDKLFVTKQLFSLSKSETLKEIAKISSLSNPENQNFNIESFTNSVNENLSDETIDWYEIATLFGNAISRTIGSDQFDLILEKIKQANDKFQEYIKENYAQIKNSNSIKKPQIVSKILDYIDFNFKEEPVALIVVDGLSFWQYSLIADRLLDNKKEAITFSWIPSITQLSRQSIFRGSSPLNSYKQNPTNESRLWKKYWKSKNFNDFEIDYKHDTVNLTGIDGVKRLGLVYKDLDDYMHSSKDYIDLLKLTENWFERSRIQTIIQELLSQGFRVIITSDHGNIQAKGWRGLNGKEKLGTNKSGSRSERHLEYSEKRLKDEFLDNNPELIDSVVQEEQAIYFKDDLSFSRRDDLVTHGGAHFLEVVIPFIEITNE
ncbi:PglZ domain-containing protein [Gelidibacter mesophilus]|uniref:PglZ domain-containing protein n=1 Tax=Gelidibacter mesophilus TaxID=169050 RepID=UPI00042432C1|nr:PglZ domain-containing protein [Gelidibacter mesophilus]